MADELLITGQTGLKNVSAEAIRELLSGLAGTGQYVLKGFTCTLNGATAVNVAGGVALFNGAEVYLKKTGQSVAISAGASGTNRRDLIVLRFTRTSQQDTNKESCSLVYLKGTAASSPKDPTYNTGSILDGTATVDMPIARITWTGVTPTIANIANKLQSADDFRDSISPKLTDLFLVKSVTMPNVNVGGSTVGTQKVAAPTVAGYKAIGIVGMNSWHGQLVYQACELSGNTIVVTLRNITGGSISTTGAVQVLYVKNTD